MSSFDNSDEFEDEFEDEGDSGLDFARAFSAVRRRWLPIVCAMVVCMSASTGFVSTLPNKYSASAVVQIDPGSRPLSNLQGFGAEHKADAATIESEVEIIRSRAIARRVVDLLNLRNDPEFAEVNAGSSNMASGVREPAGGNRGAGSQKTRDNGAEIAGRATSQAGRPRRDSVVQAFLSRLSAWRVRTTLLIEIRYWSSDPEKAATIANAVAEMYLSEQLDAKRRNVRLASTLLEEKVGELRIKVDAAERKVAQFKIDNGMFSSEGHVLSGKALARLMEQTIIARNATASARAKFDTAEALLRKGLDGAALADVLKSHTVRLMKEKLADATRLRAELATRYGARHPEMKKIQAKVRDAGARLGSEIDKEVAALENAFRQALLRERELNQSFEASKENEAGVERQSSVLSQLERDAQTSRSLLEALLTRFKQASETADLQLPDARIVEQADVPLVPAAPNRLKIVAMMSVGGFVLALFIVLALEFATTGLGRPEDVEQILELKHLSSLPRIGYGGNDVDDPMLAARLVIAEPQSGFAEAIRCVWRELDVQARGRGSRVILVAGSLPGEGSSVVASNLAHHYAMTGRSVLLVDGDVRRSNLTKQLAPRRETGLMDVLSRGLPVEQAILHDRITELNFLPATGWASERQSNPELLARPGMAHQFEHLKSQFDVIIVDSPPLLPVIDGRVLADYADQILFVMGWRSTPKALAKRALKGLSVNARKIVGVVVNQVDQQMLQNPNGFASQSLDGEFSGQRFAA